ncbi:hypothetical protein D4764_10G0009870 [Takifugu flavidus]|uniref:Reverse transcriptase domain-containing protein n=1 Tax=Takifugu flavidus TaxID=433684 RepID=A0A5C6PNP4_9TELE|nr:hypothetical protein D4764_10G0009870 [Takifugu flavidus]
MMKCFERLVKEHIISRLPSAFHQYQFAYRPNRSTEDAIFSPSAPRGREKMHMCGYCSWTSAPRSTLLSHSIRYINSSPLGFSTHLCNWLLDFLTNRPQCVKGCVLSPLPFTLMAHDCCARFTTNHIGKFADDTTLVGLINNNNDWAYREEVKHLVD